MAGNGEVLKEFLIALGWKIDEQSFKKFDAATGLSTRNVAKLGLAVTAAAAAAEVFATKLSASLDKLYFASKRTGASAGDINAFGYAIEQMGGSSEEAQASLENLARFMRTTPGASNILTRMFGVKPESLGDAAKSMNDIATTFQRMTARGQGPLVYRLAEMLGIDEKTMLAMSSGEYIAKQEEYNKMLRESGINLDENAKKGMEFTKTLGTLEASFGLLANKVGGTLIPYLQDLNLWILKLTGNALSKEEKPHLKYETFSEYVDKEGFGAAIINVLGRGFSAMGQGVRLAAAGYQSKENREKYYREQGFSWAQPQPPESMGSPSGNTKGTVTFFEKMGWTRAQASGIAANLARESNFNPGAAGDSGNAYGVAQWHPDRQADFAKWAGKDIKNSTLGEQLAFVHHELTQGTRRKAGDALRGLNDPSAAGAAVSRLYEAPRDMFKEATLRGNLSNQIFNQMNNSSPSVNMNATVNVNGAGGNGREIGQDVVSAIKPAFYDVYRSMNANTVAR